MRRSFLLFIVVLAALLVQSCASGRKSSGLLSSESTEDLKVRERINRARLHEVCSVGGRIKSAQGTAWLKVRKGEQSMQFPAVLRASDPDQLLLEVMNPLGGVEATIKGEGKTYEVSSSRGGANETTGGQAAWNGIPLKFAYSMALGRVPCPDLREVVHVEQKSLGATAPDQDRFIYRVPSTVEHQEEYFEFQVTRVSGVAWAKQLRWWIGSNLEPAASVTLRFEEPEESTLSPLIWEAESAQGALKFKWRKRDIALRN